MLGSRPPSRGATLDQAQSPNRALVLRQKELAGERCRGKAGVRAGAPDSK